MTQPPVCVLLGPTASGKTAVSLPLAEILGAEIVCLDSRQVFRGMEIGTAQPTPAERSRVPHHLFGVLDPNERFSAGDYGRLARETLAGIERRGGRALFVGGSGLYLRGLEGGLAAGLPHDERLRQALRERATLEGSAALHAELAQRDPATAAALHPNDAQRITRALEVIALTGRPMSEILAGARGESGAAPPADAAAGPGSASPAGRLRVVILDRPREELYARIEARTDDLLEGGMIEEVRRLLDAGLDTTRPVFRAHGYPEVAAWLRGEIDRSTLRARVAQVTRNYAKRQLTWFRRLPGAVWLTVAGGEDPGLTARRAAPFLTQSFT